MMTNPRNREIDSEGYVIIEPLIQTGLDKKTDVKKYNRVYHREYYRRFMSVRVPCELCGCSVTKEKVKVHQKSAKCLRLREFYQNKDSETE